MINLSDDKKENDKNPYPVDDDGKVYVTKSADKPKKTKRQQIR